MVVSAPNRASTKAVDAKALLAAVEVVAAFVASFEPGRYSASDATTLLSAFTRGERLCAAGKAHCAHRVAESNAHLRTGHRTPAEWLAATTGESVAEAGKLLTLGENLSSQPSVDEAFRNGELSASRTQLVSDAARVNPGREDDLVKGAKGPATHRQLRDECLRAKAQGRTREEAARHDEALHRARRCRTFVDRDGAFHLEALLHPTVGAKLLSVLDQRTDRIFEKARSQGQRELTDAYRADALVALCTRGGSRPSDQADDDSHDGDDDEDRPDSTSSRYRPGANVRIDIAPLRNGEVGDGDICELPGVGPVSYEEARALMGTALLRVILLDGVDVTTICHLGRAKPAALRTAVFERDQCCVVPGCDTRLGLDMDHWEIDFINNGPLSLQNAAMVCHHHHLLRTHNGFKLLGGPGKWRWVAPQEPTITPRQRKKLARTTGASKRRRPKPKPPPDPPLFRIQE